MNYDIVGVNSSFKGIRTFCLSSAIVMTCIFFTTFTFYMACLILIMSKQVSYGIYEYNE